MMTDDIERSTSGDKIQIPTLTIKANDHRLRYGWKTFLMTTRYKRHKTRNKIMNDGPAVADIIEPTGFRCAHTYTLTHHIACIGVGVCLGARETTGLYMYLW
eukprot:GHVU01122712.1.p2 GENE.GHVU01122712.1~~GHVU01122712.1.p2  ORF type:complete len:102 (+),score=6.33 GHVU01122712.1:122-427(+)